MSRSENLTPPRIGTLHDVYVNAHQRTYKVQLYFDKYQKEIFVNDFGTRVGVVVHGPNGILLTRQYRYLVNRVTWEVPGGRVDLGEDLESAAKRECLEETGVRCYDLDKLIFFHPGLDTVHNPTHLFHASKFEIGGFQQQSHGNEVCGCDWVTLNRCISMISSGVIVDSLSVIALLSYNTFVKQK